MDESTNQDDLSFSVEHGTRTGALGQAAFGRDLESDHEPTHDLPSPEEYRSNMVVGSPSQGFQSRSDNSGNDGTAGNESEIMAHDQLPSVEEYRAGTGSGGSSSREFLHYIAIFIGLVIVTGLIVVPVVLTRDNQSEPKSTSSDKNPQIMEAPTVPPAQRRSTIIEHLVTAQITSEAHLTTSGTPQNKALEWMVTDEYQMPVPEIPRQYSRFVERYALAVFFFSTNGNTWRYDMTFLSPIDHCDWNSNFQTGGGDIITFGITNCNYVAEEPEIGGGLMVTEVALPRMELSGSIPTEIQFLPLLETLDVQFNHALGGTLDFGLHNLRRMQDFDARYCALTGTIPDEIGNLQKLTNLALGNNKLDGRLPDSFFTLEDLTFLGLDDNLLSASIGQFSVFTKLQLAYLENNLFTGTLSEDLVTMWSNNLIELDLSGNSINSTIPSGIFAMPKLVVLDLNGNHLRGSIPDLVTQETSLELLALYDNDLTGVIPDTLSRLSPTLRHLDLSKNMLTTPLPDTLGQLTGLTYLFLGQNSFSRHNFPTVLYSLTSLKELSMNRNGLTGIIPSEIRLLSSLTLLDLDMNELVGTIPNELGYLDKLEVIMLNRNNLSGPIPSTFSRLHDLTYFLIDHNKVNGTADVICLDDQIKVHYFVADCEGPSISIQCSCCHLCCNGFNETCNQLSWEVSMDPMWEYGYARYNYQFGSEVFPVKNP